MNSLRSSIESAPPRLKTGAKRLLVGAIAIFLAITAWKYYSYKSEEAARAREIAAGPLVKVAKVTRSPGEHTVNVIGETRPYQTAILYAKVSGYLRDVRVDKGDIVKKGQILAVIESPETDQAYQAALADNKNKVAIAARISTLKAKGLVSQQEADQAISDADVSSARLQSQGVEKGYETIRAPFNGTVTARFADPGALVQNAMSSQASALPIVTVSEIKRLRVDVFIDQRDAPYVEADAPVEISMTERPGFKLEGKVARVSGELDPRTKMLLTEIDIPNDERALVAGSFVQVSLKIKSQPYIETPVEALVLKNDKTYLTVVTPNNLITYRQVEIADNDGKILRLVSGIQQGEMVALNVGDTIPEGGKVRPLADAAPVAVPAAATAPSGAVAAPAPGAAPASGGEVKPAVNDNSPGAKKL